MTMLLDIPSQRTGTTELSHDTHGDPPKLTHDELQSVHAETLAAPRRKYSPIAKAMFLQMDLLYGRKMTLEKFMVLEIVARVPYQTWETASYKKITRNHRKVGLALRIFDRLKEFRAQQDNEQWHLLILSELVERSGKKTGAFRFRFLPKVMAFTWWNICWLMYAVKPSLSHRLNADFEDHAEHSYAELVEANPEFDVTPYESQLCAEYGAFDSLGDLFRQIGHDERCHKRESEQHLLQPRVK